MATIILGTIGAIFGGPFGAKLGQVLGSTIDGKLFGKSREGPRLAELSVTTSSYGMPIPRQFGQMRVAGQIIWSTDLQESREKHGNGKGQPSTTEYSYSASFAVALSSRPIIDVGRIWADGKLLRGAAGDLKVGGSFRLNRGHGDQAPDPLIIAAEGVSRAPAHSGLAYAVFEDLQLGDYGNRIPALTFELFADSGTLEFGDLLEGTIADYDAAVTLGGLGGISADGPLIDVLEALDPLYPVDCDASGELLTIRPDRHQSAPLALPEAATSSGDGQFGGKDGFTRRRAPEPEQPLSVLRYYDVDRDYQPGVQRAAGRPLPGQPRSIELPAALTASNARTLVEAAARRAQWSRQAISWRVTEIDPAVIPGAVVTVPDHPGQWRVRDWEWQEHGVDLGLVRLASAAAPAAAGADPGRANSAPDQTAAPTTLAALELPWDGSSARLPPQILAVPSSSNPGWSGAALYVDQGDGALLPLGPSGRGRGVIGLTDGALPAASPLVFDRHGEVTVTLVGTDLALTDATMRQLAMGANRALLGAEIIQFGQALPLGSAKWQLSGLWRGRGGTESAVSGHAAGDRFVLLDGSGTLLDAEAVGTVPGTLIAAIGLADASPVTAPIALRGIGLRPLSPVHGSVTTLPDGTVRVAWIRRARGAWTWDDGVETPLNEQAEAWFITYGAGGFPIASWESPGSALLLPAAEFAALVASAPGGAFRAAQRGDRGVSQPLVIPLT